ncbi:MAG: peptide ABC transporter substrate-binding protein [Alphaproteobacteria bacterium]|nr:peptide ABC transporter substrate-binding protein [Alphaproteobacteria bacterium]
MMRRLVCSLFALSVLATMGACAPRSKSAGLTVINRGNGPDLKSLDPAYIDGNWEYMVVGDMLMGLTTVGPDGKPVPGAASHWTVSRDGLSWTFYLRHETWSDGVPVTAADFITAWRREVDPKTGALYSNILWPIKNAKAITEGKMPPSALGVEAVNPLTLKIELAHPTPYLLQIMEHEATLPIPRHTYVKYGANWSAVNHYVANGPYIVKTWIPLDHITLVKNPRFYDAKDVHIDVENFYVTNDTEAALKRYRAGELDTLSSYPALEINWLRRNIPNQIKSVPYLATDYIVINFKNPLFANKRLREVLELAVDRSKIVDQIRRLGEPPALSLVPPGISNYPHTAQLWFKSMPYAQRLAKARAIMRQMGYGPGRPLQLSYLTDTNPDNMRTAAVLQSMYAAVYIQISIRAEELQDQLSDMQQGNFQLGDTAWVADFDDASNFLDLLRCGNQQNLGEYCNPQFDTLMAEAQQQPDAKVRGKILSAAEELGLNDYALIPLFFNVTQNLVKPYVKGWIANPQDLNSTRWLRIDHHSRRR